MKVLYTHPDTGIVSCIESDNIESCTFDVEIAGGTMDTAPVIAVCQDGIPLIVSPITDEEMAHKERLNGVLKECFTKDVIDLTGREFHFSAFTEMDDEDDPCLDDFFDEYGNFRPDFYNGDSFGSRIYDYKRPK